MNESVEIAARNQANASDPNVSVWVAANAGTGKTHVLTQRVIRLLLGGTPPERILCLTFTKAAAAEMAHRLFGDLGKWATLPNSELRQAYRERIGDDLDFDDLPKARRLFAQALETPGGLKIQTIHAFCEGLLRRFTLEARVPPDFEVLDERASRELMTRAIEEMLEQAAEDRDDRLSEAHDLLVTQIDEFGFEELFQQVVSKRNQIEFSLRQHGGLEGLLTALRKALSLKESDSVESLTLAAMSLPDFDHMQVKQACNKLATGLKSDQVIAGFLSRSLAAEDLLESFDLYAAAFMTKEGARRARLVTKGIAEAHPEIVDFMTDEQERISGILDRIKAIQIYESSAALFLLSERVLFLYDQEKRHHGALDYDDLIGRTVDLLRQSSSASWVLYKLDGGLDHILVDEAQDTSEPQWAVVETLTEEFFSGLGARKESGSATTRTIFAVGDEKQSIYSFQGADPEMFSDMQRRFAERIERAGEKWQPVDFQLSFRSTDTILQAVDAIFETDELFRRLTSTGRPTKHVARRHGQAGLVEIWPLVQDEAADAAEIWDAPLDQESAFSAETILAKRIADKIAGWLDRGELLQSKARPIEPGDILILVRRRGEFMDRLIRELKSRAIPVAGADRLDLLDQLAIQDTLAVARFALLPTDDLNLAALLKSPFVGLNDEDLFNLCHGRKSSLWSSLQAAAKSDRRFRKAADFLANYRDLADRVPPFEFFHRLVDGDTEESKQARTGRRRLVERLGRESNDMLDELLSLALNYERGRVPTLQGFLDWLSGGDAELKREQDQGAGLVRVMTVHGAKGLDGNIVILPDTCQTPDAKSDDWILPLAGGSLFWRPGRKDRHDAVTQAARDDFAQRRDAEYYRLLYVAATRARDRLYICGYHGSREPKPECWYGYMERALSPLMQTVVDDLGQTVLRMEQPQSTLPERDRYGSDSVRRPLKMPAWMTSAIENTEPVSLRLTPSTIDDAGRNVVEDQPVLSPLTENGAFRFLRGQLIHRLLEYLPDCPPRRRLELAKEYVRRHGGALSEDDRVQLIDETLAVIDDAGFGEIFSAASQAEVSLSGLFTLTDGRSYVVSGQVDRLCETDEHVLVIDYKTNRPPPCDEKDLAMVYRRQMAVYRHLLQQIYPGKVIRCGLLWTDEPRLMVLSDGLLDDTIAQLATA